MNKVALFNDNGKQVSMSISLEARDTIGDIAENSKFTITQVKAIISDLYLDEYIPELDDYMTIGDISRYCKCTVDDLIKKIQNDIINIDEEE